MVFHTKESSNTIPANLKLLWVRWDRPFQKINRLPRKRKIIFVFDIN